MYLYLLYWHSTFVRIKDYIHFPSSLSKFRQLSYNVSINSRKVGSTVPLRNFHHHYLANSFFFSFRLYPAYSRAEGT